MSASLGIIHKLLDGHAAADESEARSLARIRELLAGAENPFSRQNFIPGHLTASGVVLDPARGRTLLIFHKKLQRWLQPGGHFEPGETDPGAAAAREVLEETGLAPRAPGAAQRLLDVDVHGIPARKEDPPHCHFDLRMLLIADPDQGAGAVAGDGVEAARWVSPGEFAALDLDPGLLRALRKLKAAGGQAI
jgi:8-oxo-dGTP pyrophosphatase MutT (NUDIX family)